jgi:hypothetical protein
MALCLAKKAAWPVTWQAKRFAVAWFKDANGEEKLRQQKNIADIVAGDPKQRSKKRADR